MGLNNAWENGSFINGMNMMKNDKREFLKFFNGCILTKLRQHELNEFCSRGYWLREINCGIRRRPLYSQIVASRQPEDVSSWWVLQSGAAFNIPERKRISNSKVVRSDFKKHFPRVDCNEIDNGDLLINVANLMCCRYFLGCVSQP